PGPRLWRAADGLRSDFVFSALALPDGALLVGYTEQLGVDRVLVDPGGLRARPLRDPGARSPRPFFVRRDAVGDVWLATGAGGADVPQAAPAPVPLPPAGAGRGVRRDRPDPGALRGPRARRLPAGGDRALRRRRREPATRRARLRDDARLVGAGVGPRRRRRP